MIIINNNNNNNNNSPCSLRQRYPFHNLLSDILSSHIVNCIFVIIVTHSVASQGRNVRQNWLILTMTQLIKLFGEDSSSLVRMKVVKNRMGMSMLRVLRGTQIYQQFKNKVVEVVISQKIFKVPRRFSCLSFLRFIGKVRC